MRKLLPVELQWFVSQLRSVLWKHVLSIIMMIVASLTFLLDPLLVKWLIDVVLPAKDKQLLSVAAAGISGIYLVQLVCSAMSGALNFHTIQSLVCSIRLALFEQMNLLSAEFHESVPVGDKLYRIEQDVDQIAELGATLVPSVLQTAFTCLFVTSTMLVLNARLTSVLLPLLPLFVLVKKHYQTRLRRAADSAQERASNETNFLQEHLYSILQIQLLNQERLQTKRFLSHARERMAAVNRRNIHETLFRTWYVGVTSLGSIAILSYGGLQVFERALTIGGFIAFYSYVGRLFAPLSAAVDIYARLNRLTSSTKRVLSVLKEVPSVKESPTSTCLPLAVGKTITLEAVAFAYRGNPEILKDFHLSIRAGEKIALLGFSGSGKSTVAKLLVRLYDVGRGSIRINDSDVRDVTLNSLRESICYVPQEPLLFDRSIKDNLLLGDPDATHDQIQTVIEIVGLTHRIRGLTKGWDTSVGPRGNFLSGGERQRLAIARAALRPFSVLLLDESTSALDVPSERRVYLNLTRHFAERTIVFISHRVASLTWVDRIVVLSQGRVLERGTHDELVRMNGLYTRLYKAQPSLARAEADLPFA
jgi:ABC-type bacteriocin/lantibiotic exporter with double-glycine peptidase domain